MTKAPPQGDHAWHPIGIQTSRWETLAMAITLGAFGAIGLSITSPLLPDLADEFGVSTSATGVIQAAVSIPGVVFSLLIGYFADRFGRRRVVLVGLSIYTIFGIAGFVARSFEWLVAVRFLQGVGLSATLGLGIVIVSDAFDGPDRDRALGINLVGLTAISIMGPVLSGALATIDLFLPFLIFLAGIPLALWATRMKSDRPTASAEPPLRHLRDAITTMRARGTFITYIGVLVATIAVVIVMHGIALTVVPLFLDGELGTSVGSRGIVIATFQIGMILASLSIATSWPRAARRTTVTVAFFMLGLGMVLSALAVSAVVVAVALTISGIGFGLFTPLAQGYSSSVASLAYRGVTVLTWVTTVRIAQVIGPPAGSVGYDEAGSDPVFWLMAALMFGFAVAWHPFRSAVTKRAEGGEQ